MKRFIIVFFLLSFLFYGCAGSSNFTKDVGNILKFSIDVVGLGLLFSGHGSSAHIPSAALDTFLDFGKAVDSAAGEEDIKE